jgi:hypothetical protein
MKGADEYISLVALEFGYDMMLLGLERAMAYMPATLEQEAEYVRCLKRIQEVREQLEIFDIIDVCNTSHWKWLP